MTRDKKDEKKEKKTIDANFIGNHKRVQLKYNHIPRGLIPLEFFFDENDMSVKPMIQPREGDIEEVNIRSPEHRKTINLSKSLPIEQKESYVKLFKEFIEVFAWSYADLKIYDIFIIEHRIPLEKDVNPFRQKLIQVNPILLPMIEKEIHKWLDAKITISLRYSEWVANLVPVRKKNGEIRIC